MQQHESLKVELFFGGGDFALRFQAKRGQNMSQICFFKTYKN